MMCVEEGDTTKLASSPDTDEVTYSLTITLFLMSSQRVY